MSSDTQFSGEDGSRIRSKVVHTKYADYELHTLGWKAFQDLVLTVLRHVWGQTVQAFCETKDQGRDGAFFGTWSKRSGAGDVRSLSGTFAVQCKFTSDPSKRPRKAQFAHEVEKAKRLAEMGLADHYFLFVSVPVTAGLSEELSSIFRHPKMKSFTVYGKESLTAFIAENKTLRMQIPRLYGLGDLSQILDERAYVQAEQILSSMGDDLRKFVITESYTRSANALRDKGFVTLLGAPATGKSTIAAALAVGAIDAFSAIPIKVRNEQEFVKHWNPDERQFFWIDDVFGATQLNHQLVQDWNQALKHLRAAIENGSKVLMTSRDYVFNSARDALKHSEFPLFHDSQVIISVDEIAQSDRDQILYNHIKFGKHSKEQKKALKAFLPLVSRHPQFGPETARRLGDPFFTRNLSVSEEGLKVFVSDQLRLLQETIQGLDEDHRAALALVFIRGGRLQSPVEIAESESRLLTRIGSDLKGVCKALKALKETLVLNVLEHGEYIWKFKHPTIQDAYASLISLDSDLLDLYLLGAPLSRLFSEIACETASLDGVKIVLPRSRYGQLLNRLCTHVSQGSSRGLNLFLVHRCDMELLSQFAEANPNYVENLKVRSYLADSSSVSLICRLHSQGLLSVPKYEASVAQIAKLAIETPDTGFSITRIKEFLGTENSELVEGAFRAHALVTIRAQFFIRRLQFDPLKHEPSVFFHDTREALNQLISEKSKIGGDVAVDKSLLRFIDEEIEYLRSKRSFDDDGLTPSRESSLKDCWSPDVFIDVDE